MSDASKSFYRGYADAWATRITRTPPDPEAYKRGFDEGMADRRRAEGAHGFRRRGVNKK